MKAFSVCLICITSLVCAMITGILTTKVANSLSAVWLCLMTVMFFTIFMVTICAFEGLFKSPDFPPPENHPGE